MPTCLLVRPTTGGVNFDPRMLPGLDVWLDAGDSSTVTLNSGNVSEWRDKSGNTRNASQSTAASQPSYKSASQNGRNVIGFGGSKFLTCTVPFGSASTLFLVTTPSTQDNAYILGSSGSGDVGGSPAIISRFSNGGTRRDYEWYLFRATPEATDRVILATTQSGFSVLAVTHDGTSSMFGYINGTQVGTRAPLQITISGRNLSVIGAALATGVNSAICDVAEILLYNRVLSTAERNLVTRMLGRKWGVTV